MAMRLGGAPYGLEVTAVLRSFERLLCQWAPKTSHFWALEMSHFRGCPAGSGATGAEQPAWSRKALMKLPSRQGDSGLVRAPNGWIALESSAWRRIPRAR